MYRLILYGFIAMSISSTIVYILLTTTLGLNDIKSASIEKMTTSIMDDLNQAMPLIEEAGYTMSAVEAELSLPPEITTEFELERIVEHEKQLIILKALDNNAIGKLVLTSLMQAFKLNEKISIKDMSMKEVGIVISFPPFVKIKYEK